MFEAKACTSNPPVGSDATLSVNTALSALQGAWSASEGREKEHPVSSSVLAAKTARDLTAFMGNFLLLSTSTRL
jgi:hypothetical protein